MNRGTFQHQFIFISFTLVKENLSGSSVSLGPQYWFSTSGANKVKTQLQNYGNFGVQMFRNWECVWKEIM